MKFIYLFIIFIGIYNPSFSQFRDGLDFTFGDKGIVLNENFPGMGGSDQITNALLQPDGKILTISGNMIVRFLSDGKIDSSFGENGISKEKFKYKDGTDISYIVNQAFALHSDGKIVILASADGGSWTRSKFVLYRLLANGLADRSFGVDGIVSDTALNSYERDDIKVQADDKIVISGEKRGSYYKPSLIRFLNNGDFDSSFGVNGIAINPYPDMLSTTKIEIQPDGKILQLLQHYKVVRYLADGDIDSSFGTYGLATVYPFSASSSYSPSSNGLALCADGTILIAGGTTSLVSVSPFIVARLKSDGSNDLTYGSAGIAEFSWDTGKFNECRKVLPLSDGSAMLVGTVMNVVTARDNFALIKVLADGSIDNSFGDYGRILTQLNGSTVLIDEAFGVLEQTDKKIIAFGVTATPAIKGLGAMVRYLPTGKNSIREENTPTSEKFEIFPNPVSNTLNLNYPANGSAELKITDLLGRPLLKVTLPTGQSRYSTDTKEWPAGLYIYQITNNTGLVSSGKIMKQ